MNKEQTKAAKQVDRDELSEDQLQDASGGGELVDPGSSQCFDSAEEEMGGSELSVDNMRRFWPQIRPKDDSYNR